MICDSRLLKLKNLLVVLPILFLSILYSLLLFLVYLSSFNMNAEERRLLLEETMLIMDQRIAELRIQDRNNGNTEDKSLRIHVSEFTNQA